MFWPTHPPDVLHRYGLKCSRNCGACNSKSFWPAHPSGVPSSYVPGMICQSINYAGQRWLSMSPFQASMTPVSEKCLQSVGSCMAGQITSLGEPSYGVVGCRRSGKYRLSKQIMHRSKLELCNKICRFCELARERGGWGGVIIIMLGRRCGPQISITRYILHRENNHRQKIEICIRICRCCELGGWGGGGNHRQ